jgi:hypothetical protein
VLNSDMGTGICMAAPLAMLSTVALCASDRSELAGLTIYHGAKAVRMWAGSCAGLFVGRIEHHSLGLAQIGAHEHHPAVAEAAADLDGRMA